MMKGLSAIAERSANIAVQMTAQAIAVLLGKAKNLSECGLTSILVLFRVKKKMAAAHAKLKYG